MNRLMVVRKQRVSQSKRVFVMYIQQSVSRFVSVLLYHCKQHHYQGKGWARSQKINILG